MPYPIPFYMRVGASNALTHAELDSNQQILSDKIDLTVGNNLGNGAGIYLSKTANANDGFLNFRTLAGLSGTSIFISGDTLVFVNDGDFCHTPVTANQIEACDCTSGVTINTNCDGCGDVNFGVSGVTFNYNSTSSYTFPCFDGAVNYVLCTDGYGNVNWCPPQSGGTVSADTFISNFTLTNETNLQIFRNDGVSWNVDISGVTPYHYGEGYRAIEPRVTSQHQSYARGELSNVQGGYYNIVDLDSNFSFIGGGLSNDLSGSSYSLIVGGQKNDIIAYVASGLTFSGNTLVGGSFNRLHGVGSSFIGGGLQNKIQRAFELTGATPVSSLIVGGEYNIITGETQGVSVIVGGKDNVVGYGVTGNFIGGGYENTIEHMYGGYSSIVGGSKNVISGDTYSSIVGGQENRIDGDNTEDEQSLNNFIGGGKVNQLDNTVGAAIVGGFHNTIKADAGSVDGEGTEKYREYSFIGAGEHNQIQGGTDNVVVGGHRNIIQSGSSWSSIVGGSGNTINQYSNYSFIGGGTGNTINHRYGFIGAGQDNTIHTLSQFNESDAFHAAIISGRLNQVRSKQSIIGAGNGNIIEIDSFRSAILSGRKNLIFSGSPNSLIGVGVTNTIYENNNSAAIVAGAQNQIHGNHNMPVHGLNSKYAFIGGGFANEISGYSSTVVAGINNEIKSTYGFIGAGLSNSVKPGSTASSIVGGQLNEISGSIYTAVTNVETYEISVMSATSTYSFIGGGFNNLISGSTNSLVGGINNKITKSASVSFIGGGSANTLEGPADRMSILGGQQNTVLSARFSAILNGSGNTIYSHSEDSAIIGGSSLIATSASTTFMHGLDVDTGTRHGDRPFKYHGSFTNSNINFVLTSIDNDGTAVWKPAPGTTSASTVPCTGDEYVVSATTSGCCQLVLTTNSGTTIIQDICNDLGPYQWGESPNSIRPVLPNAPGDVNFFDTSSDLSGIMAGRANTISGSPYSFIGGGNRNMIDIEPTSPYGWNAIVHGSNNKILNKDGDSDAFSSLIVNGDKNIISGGTRNSILNGLSNRVGADYATVLNGAYNISNHRASTIVGGVNIMSLTSHTVYMNGLSVNSTLSDPLIGGERYFQYHGAITQQGQNKFLKDVDGFGNAVWSDIPGRPSLTGDTFAVSAYTSGCTLYITVSDGTVLTADTCNNFSEGPYRYDSLVDNIVPKLPSTAGIVNKAGDGVQWTTYNNIAGGQRNKIFTSWDTTSNSIINGYQNVISGQTSYAGVGGYKNIVGTSSSGSHVFGSNNILHQVKNSLVGGSENFLYSTNDSLMGGSTNKIWRASQSSILAGNDNVISADTQTSRSDVILGGISNKIISQGITGLSSNYSTILNGNDNRIWRGSSYGLIGNGHINYISGVTYATIINGIENRIFPNGKEGVVKYAPEYSVIVNGTGNTISYEHNASAIIGGVNIDAVRSQTTHMKGLEVNTDTTEGSRQFTYKGGYANPGFGSFLMDSTGGGDAVWSRVPIIGYTGGTLTGDTYVVSAHTSGCTLFITLTDGTVYDTNICDGFTDSPYRYDEVNENIVPKLPSNPTIVNRAGHNGIITQWNNIAGGYKNKIWTFYDTSSNAIVNGYNNIISGQTSFATVGGYSNKVEGVCNSSFTHGHRNINYDSYSTNILAYQSHVHNSDMSSILGGNNNKILLHATSSIAGGSSNVLSARTIGGNTFIGGGYENWIVDGAYVSPSASTPETSIYSLIVGGWRNKIWQGSTSSSILGGGYNYISGTTYAHILGGKENRIFPNGKENIKYAPHYASIVNGSGNTISYHYNASAIIGGVDISATRSQTTFMKGLYVDTDTTEGQRGMRYHGSFANPGAGKVLTDVSGAGDAVWQQMGGPRLTGDTFAISAYTSGCTLYIDVSDGTTLTANTCNQFGSISPYEYSTAANSIRPVIPTQVSGVGNDNLHGIYHNIAGGQSNTILYGFNIGSTNVAKTFNNAIINGMYNTISGNTNNSAIGGRNNLIVGGSSLGAGEQSSSHSVYLFGTGGYIQNSSHTTLAGGQNSSIIDSEGGFIGAGVGNKMRWSKWSSLVGGGYNYISGATHSFIGGGKFNVIEANQGESGEAMYSFIGGGGENTITSFGSDNREAAIVGGRMNEIWNGGMRSFIGAGLENKISGVTDSSIVGGYQNTITQAFREGMEVPHYSSILNGSGNTISLSHVGAAVLGGVNISSSKSQTTHMKGLYVNTDTTEGARPFRYYGSFANPGPAGKVLTDISGSGDAVWQQMGGPRLTGDTFAVSAYTSGCTLYINVSDGTILTANTCNQFGSISPYEYSTGTDSIRPVIPTQASGVGNDNKQGFYHNIAGGQNNTILFGAGLPPVIESKTFNNAIINGDSNTISGNTNNSWLSGSYNLMVDSYVSAGGGNLSYMENATASSIQGGWKNSMVKSVYSNIDGGHINKIGNGWNSSIQNGTDAVLSGDSRSIGIQYGLIGNGLDNHIYSHFQNDVTSHSTILNGNDNRIWRGSSHGTILNGLWNYISGSTFAGILGGKENRIFPSGKEPGSEQTPNYSVIVNGSGNTITGGMKAAAIIGGVDITASRSQTTHMKGLYVNTNTTEGQRGMRYYGSFANPGTNRILTSINGSGDAVWKDTRNVDLTGDTFAVSAYTSGCTMYVLVSNGTVLTANTCNEFTEGPYRYDTGWGTIVPKLPATALQENEIRNGYYNNIGGGKRNLITGVLNTFTPTPQEGYGETNYSSILGGDLNTISGATVGSHIGGGLYNFINRGIYSSIVGGVHNRVEGGHYGVAVGGSYHLIKDTSRGYVGQGLRNTVVLGKYNSVLNGQLNAASGVTTTGGQYGLVGNGMNNQVLHRGNVSGAWNFYGSILNGEDNRVWDRTYYSHIGNGLKNQISGATYASIHNGKQNFISGIELGGEGVVHRETQYPTILNGSGNTISAWADASVILGGVDIQATLSQTTYMKGLDVDTDTHNGHRKFRYHGTWANEQSGRFLKSVNNLGDAVWADIEGPRVDLSGDTYAISAYTSGCTLYIDVSDGTTLTADTCGSFSEGPYEYGTANESIRPKLPPQSSFWKNRVLQGQNHNIAGGRGNLIVYSIDSGLVSSKITSNGIINGDLNTISGASYFSAMGGNNNYMNTVVEGGEEAAMGQNSSSWMFGFSNYLENSKSTSIAGGEINSIQSSNKTFIGAGNNNKIITNSHDSAIVGGKENIILRSRRSFIGGGLQNTISGTTNDSLENFIGGGHSNKIVSGLGNEMQLHSSIVGGLANILWQGSGYGFMGGGRDNFVSGTTYSSILNGKNNRIFPFGKEAGSEGVPDYSAIINGTGNTIAGEFKSAVVMGGNNIFARRSQTTHMKGLYVDTDTTEGTRAFTYKGSFANPGIGRVLKSMNSSGDAYWADPNSIQMTGDTFAVSAFTNGCVLNVLLSDGVTLTANTCNEFTDSPYRYDFGNGNIIPKMPSSPNTSGYNIAGGPGSVFSYIGGGRYNGVSGFTSAIGGGTSNKVQSAYGFVGGGNNNHISTGIHYSSIVGGHNNEIVNGTANWFNFIGGGRDNRIVGNLTGAGGGSQLSSIVGGEKNLISGTTATEKHSSIVGGESNTIVNGMKGAIVNGQENSISGAEKSSFSSILNGQGNLILSDTAPHYYGHILGGSGHTTQSIAHSSAILGGVDMTAFTPSTTYLGSAQAHGRVRIASKEFMQSSNANFTSSYQTPVTTLDVVHDNNTFSTMSAGTAGGEIVRFGSKGDGYLPGTLVQLKNGSWYRADADDTSQQGNMLGISLGVSPSLGILIRGFAALNPTADGVTTWSVGGPLYVSQTAGQITETAPSASNRYVRVVGYMAETANLVYFNPDGTFIKIA